VALEKEEEVTFEEREVLNGAGRGGGGTAAVARATEVSKFELGESYGSH
jgi:hypothetical protein